MRRNLIFAFLIVFCFVEIFAQNFSIAAKPKGKKPENSQMSDLRKAYQLAEYGYANDSANALIMAARMLSEMPTQPIAAQPVKYGTATKSGAKEAKPLYTPEQLLADGVKLAGNDKALKMLADEVSAELKKTSTTRGAIGGPKSDTDIVFGNGYIVYTIPFKGGVWGEVYMTSLDGVDLDLYILDPDGNVIEQDNSYAVEGHIIFLPPYDMSITVVVKNDTNRNSCFALFTN